MSRYVGSHIPRRWRHAARPIVRPARGPIVGLVLLAMVAALAVWAIMARLTAGADHSARVLVRPGTHIQHHL